MYPSLIDPKQENFQIFECPNCMSQYDEGNHSPMLLCIQKHSACKKCVTEKISAGQPFKCYQCRRQVNKDQFIKFKHLQSIKKTAMQIRKEGSKAPKYVKEDLELKLRQEQEQKQWLIHQCNQKQRQIKQLELKLNAYAERSAKLQYENQKLRQASANQSPNSLNTKKSIVQKKISSAQELIIEKQSYRQILRELQQFSQESVYTDISVKISMLQS